MKRIRYEYITVQKCCRCISQSKRWLNCLFTIVSCFISFFFAVRTFFLLVSAYIFFCQSFGKYKSIGIAQNHKLFSVLNGNRGGSVIEQISTKNRWTHAIDTILATIFTSRGWMEQVKQIIYSIFIGFERLCWFCQRRWRRRRFFSATVAPILNVFLHSFWSTQFNENANSNNSMQIREKWFDRISHNQSAETVSLIYSACLIYPI